ncbi:MAG TPA: hypothetical protein PLA81_07770, partial [Syntrophorhabdaceae bacterium]|nr:hypothetical protein [Syntrophorhabdaceae bacterium]
MATHLHIQTSNLLKKRVRGFKDSRIQVEKDRGLEGWRVRGLATPLHFQTSNLLREKRDSYTSNLLTLQPSTHLHIQTSKLLQNGVICFQS